jgi:hypothetical protein
MLDVEEIAHLYSFLFALHKKNRVLSSYLQLVIRLIAILSQTASFAIGLIVIKELSAMAVAYVK